MSHLDQAAVHHWRPKQVIAYIHRGYRGEDGKRNSLHRKHPSVVQIFAFCHANSISMNWEKQDQWVGDVKGMPWWGVVRQDGVKHKPTFPYEMMLSFPFTVWFVLLPCKYLKIKWNGTTCQRCALKFYLPLSHRIKKKGLSVHIQAGKGTARGGCDCETRSMWFRLVTNCYGERTLDNPLLWNLSDQTHAKWTFERGWAQRLIRKVFTEGTCKGCFLRLVQDVSFQLQLLLRWWTYKKNAGFRHRSIIHHLCCLLVSRVHFIKRY